MIDDLEDRKTNATGIEDISKLTGEEVKSNFQCYLIGWEPFM